MSVWRSLTLFRRNAGLFASASFATVAVLVTLAGAEAIIHGRYAEAILVFWPMVALSWVLRWTLLGLAVRYGNALRYVAVAIGVAYITRPKGGWFPGDDWIMISMIALYFGLIFWWQSGNFSMVLAGAVMPEEPSEDSDRDDGLADELDVPTARGSPAKPRGGSGR